MEPPPPSRPSATPTRTARTTVNAVIAGSPLRTGARRGSPGYRLGCRDVQSRGGGGVVVVVDRHHPVTGGGQQRRRDRGAVTGLTVHPHLTHRRAGSAAHAAGHGLRRGGDPGPTRC